MYSTEHGNPHEKYEMKELIGSGVYGTVYKALDRMSGRTVAIKQLKMEEDIQIGVPTHVIREASLLRDFVHPNIVELIDIDLMNPQEFSLVFEYVDSDLGKMLKTFRKAGQQMPLELVKKYASDLLCGLHACHQRLILHRDLKPQNLLIGADGLKIADFGLSRMFALQTKDYTLEVVTLWYRAPEMLLGAQRYGLEVDIWSVGCIIAEMATGSPTFPGDSEIGTIFKQFQILGTPSEAEWPGVTSLEHWKNTFPRWPRTELQNISEGRPEMSPDGMDLLKSLLAVSPAARIKSRKAKNSPFLQGAPIA